MSDMISRRKALSTIGAASVAVFTPRLANAQTAQKAEPPSVISNPPRDFARPVTYPDPDIITHDPSFNSLRVGNTPIQRLWTGGMWCEGPAWNGQGRYLIWSDIRVPPAVGKQQRQHVRSSGAPAVV
jgi:gluconolactonase